MKTKTKLMMAAVATVPTVIYAAVLTDDGLDTGGNNTVSASENSVAVGTGNNVESKSLAVGELNNVGTNGSTSGGGKSLAVGTSNSINSTGYNALAVGTSNTVTGTDSGAVGTYNAVWGGGSFAAGSGNNCWTFTLANNILLGKSNTALYGPINCVIMGESNYSANTSSWVLGKGNAGLAETVTLGTYSDHSSVAPDAALVVGTGSDGSNRSNGLVVYKNGDVVISKSQGDIDEGIFGN